jgi:hypothetical protein
MMEVVKSSSRKSFSMKDLGEAAYILGIKIYRDRSKRLIGLSQEAYIDKILNLFNMQDSKKGFLSMSHGSLLARNSVNGDCHSSLKTCWKFLCSMENFPNLKILRFGTLVFMLISHGTWSDTSLASVLTLVLGYSNDQFWEIKNQSNLSKRGFCCLLVHVIHV